MNRRVEFPLLGAIFLDMLGFGMVIADIQLRAESLVPAGWPKGIVIGAVLASMFIVQTLVSPRWGGLSDRIGRKPVILVCGAISAAAMFVFGLAPSIGWLLVSRVLAGVGAANVAVAQANLADVYAGAERTAAMGRVGGALTAGLFIGPALGGVLHRTGGTWLIGMVGGTASLIGLAAVAGWLPMSSPKESASTGRRPLFDLRLLNDIPQLRLLAGVAAVAWFSLATLEGTFARLINQMLGYDQLQFGILFSYESLVGFLIQTFALAWVVARLGGKKLLAVAYLVQGAGLALNPAAGPLAGWIPGMVTLFAASSLFAIGNSFANPTINALCSEATPEERQGELFGLLQGARSIGFVLGPILGGALFDWWAPAPYLLAGGVCVIASVLVMRARNPSSGD